MADDRGGLQGADVGRRRAMMLTAAAAVVVVLGMALLAWRQRQQAVDEAYARATAQAEAEAVQSTALSLANDRSFWLSEAAGWRRAAESMRATATEQAHVWTTSEAQLEAHHRASESAEAQARATAQAHAERWQLRAESAEANTAAEVQARATAQAVAEEEGRVARARRLAIQAQEALDETGTGLVQSVLLATESLRQHPTSAGRLALQRGLALLPYRLVQLDHGRNDVAFSPDGRLLATAGDGRWSDGGVKVWDTETWQEVANLPHEEPTVGVVAFSPDGRWLVTGDGGWPGDAGEVRAWRTAIWREERRISHSGPVNAIAFSPDGERVVSGSGLTFLEGDPYQRLCRPYGVRMIEASHQFAACGGDEREGATSQGEALVWGIETGRTVAQLPHGGEVLGVAFSPDGELVATTGDETEVWDAATGELRAQFDVAAWDVAFSTDGQQLIANSGVWSVADGRQLAFQMGEGRPFALSPDGEQVASVAEGGPVFLWDAASGEEVAWLPEGRYQVNALAFSPDGGLLASGSGRPRWTSGSYPYYEFLLGAARVLDVAREKEVARTGDEGFVNGVSFDPDGRWLATVSLDGAQVWEARAGWQVAEVEHDGAIGATAFSPDGRLVASGGEDGTVRVWEATTGREVVQLAHQEAVVGLVFSSDGRRLATRTDRVARVWGTDAWSEYVRIEPGGAVTEMLFSLDGQWLAAATQGGTIRVWETETGEEAARMAHGADVRSLRFSPEGRWVAAAGEDGRAQVWGTAVGRTLTEVAHDGELSLLAFGPQERMLVTASFSEDEDQGLVRILETTTWRQMAQRSYDEPVREVAVSPDGRWVASASSVASANARSGRVTVWEAESGETAVEEGFAGAVTAVVFSPDSRWLAAGSEDGTLQVWDAGSWEAVALVAHADAVSDVIFSPDGAWLASRCWGDAVEVWETAGWQRVARAEPPGRVDDVAFGPDGRRMLTVSGATAQVWPLAVEDLLDEACRRLTRNLTQEEWMAHVPGEPYRATCSDLPGR